MKTKQSPKCLPKDGVALIIVLGLLAVMTLLAVAFSISMRVERLAARNYANAVRAEHLLKVAIVRATEHVNKDEADGGVGGTVYPSWEAVASEGGQACQDILSGEAAKAIPGSLKDAADSAASSCKWIDLQSTVNGQTVTNGRVAYLIVNASGLLDANVVGGWEKSGYTNVHELSLGKMPDVKDEKDFIDDRKKDVRYETVNELAALNSGISKDKNENFSVFSYDPCRDQYFTDKSKLGQRDAPLEYKFNVNSITNLACYGRDNDLDKYRNDSTFKPKYWTPLNKMLGDAKLERPTDVAWNIVNWLDPDRTPQSDDLNPWAHTEGGEAIPLVNEIVLDGSGLNVTFKVEVWFPFVPVTVEPSDNMYLQVVVYDMPDPQTAAPKYTLDDRDFQATAQAKNPGATITTLDEPILHMAYDPPPEQPDYKEFQVFELPVTLTEPLSITNCLWFMARVVVKENGKVIPIDQASGPNGQWKIKQDDGNGAVKSGSQYSPQAYSEAGHWSVGDPRSNGKMDDWTSKDETLGKINIFDPDKDPWDIYPPALHQGLPIYAKDGKMLTIGEIGNIYRSNIVPGKSGTWNTIDLMHAEKGAYLLDHLTVRDPETEPPTRGLVSINSQQYDVLYALFNGMEVGYTNKTYTARAPLLANDIDSIVTAIKSQTKPENQHHVISFEDLFRDPDSGAALDDSPVAHAVQFAGINSAQADLDKYAPPNDKTMEDAFRQIIDMITFRQNMFMMVCAAQIVSPEDSNEVLAEKRGLATLYRDSYTGQSFIRSFKWLSDDE